METYKDEAVNQIYDFVLDRYKTERPGVKLTETDKDSIWFSILGELQRNGPLAAMRYAETVKLL